MFPFPTFLPRRSKQVFSVDPEIRVLLRDEGVVRKMNVKEKAARLSFFHGSYKNLTNKKGGVLNMLLAFRDHGTGV